MSGQGTKTDGFFFFFCIWETEQYDLCFVIDELKKIWLKYDWGKELKHLIKG